jgi:hypothetical protein
VALYSPSGPKPSQAHRKREPPRLIGWWLKLFGIGWAGLFAFGFLLALLDGDLLDLEACRRLALVSLICCVLTALCFRCRPEDKLVRALGAALVGFPFGVAVLGVILPFEPWPPPSPMWWVFGGMFSVAFFGAVVKPD